MTEFRSIVDFIGAFCANLFQPPGPHSWGIGKRELGDTPRPSAGGLLLHLRTTGGTGEAKLARVSRNPRPSRQRSFSPLHTPCGDRVTDRPLSRSRQEASRTSSWIGPRRSLRQRKGATHPRGPSKQRVRSRSLASFLQQFLDLRREGRESLLPVADDPESRLSEDVGLGVLVDGDDGL